MVSKHSIPDAGTIPWFITAKGSYDYCDDWVFGGSWEGYRKLYPGVYYYIAIYARMGRAAESNIFSHSSPTRIPARWNSWLNIHGKRFPVKSSHPSCKSKPDALRWADRALTPNALRECFVNFYNAPPTSCLSRVENGEVNPWLSYFGEYVPWKELPPGTYRDAYRHHDGLRYGETKTSYWGYSGTVGATIPNCPYWSKDDSKDTLVS